jgi:DivIVA domain-containing protein
MDVTPQVINEVEFHQKMRGYDPDEVDDFLERVAVAVGQLTERLQETEARAAAADRHAQDLERQLRDAGDRTASSDDDTETIRRTLVLAQKTADAAVKEARDEAERTLAEAKEKADSMVSDAQSSSRRLVNDAESEARRASEETRQRMVDEIASLEEARDGLKADHGILERHLEEQRLRLRSSIGDLQRLLDDPAKLRAASMPELSGATRPLFGDDDAGDNAMTTEDNDDDDELIDLDAGDTSRDNGEMQARDDDVVVERPITGGVRFSPPEEPEDQGMEPYSARTAVATDDDGDTDAWSRFVREEMIDDRPTGAMTISPNDDAYMVELRKAMLEDSNNGTTVGDRPARTRFGRRR